MSRPRLPLGSFVGVQWGHVSNLGRQAVHIVTGPAPAPDRAGALRASLERTLCGQAPSTGAVYPITSHGRPRVTCGRCARIAAARMTELPSGETPASRWP